MALSETLPEADEQAINTFAAMQQISIINSLFLIVLILLHHAIHQVNDGTTNGSHGKESQPAPGCDNAYKEGHNT